MVFEKLTSRKRKRRSCGVWYVTKKKEQEEENYCEIWKTFCEDFQEDTDDIVNIVTFENFTRKNFFCYIWNFLRRRAWWYYAIWEEEESDGDGDVDILTFETH